MDRLFSYLYLETLASDLVKTMPFDYVVESILKMAEDEGLEEETRHLAIKSLVSLAEGREWEFPPQFVSRVFSLLMRMILDVEDEAVWHSADEVLYVDASSNYGFGHVCLNRLADALGGNIIFPVASDQFSAYLAAPETEWREHNAALVALAQIARGCKKVMIKNSEQVVTKVLNSFHNPHPRVRWAAINAIAQLSIDLGPGLQFQYHARVLPALASAMDDFENPRVQAHAASAVTNFIEDCTPDILTPYLDGLVSKLLVLLQSGERMLQKEALSALASVAVNSSQEQFQKYYDVVMPCLKAIFVNENCILQAQAMECICSVGMAVGKDKFRDDAKQVTEVLMSLEGAKMVTDDFTSYMWACGRLCKCLGQDFLPYMELVMPRLLECAQDEDEHFFLIEERATACKVLCCIADDLKEGFFPWIEQVAPILVPLLKDYSNRVRKAAVPAMPRLLRYSKLVIEKGHDGTCLKQLSDYIVPALVKALHKEPNSILIAYKLEAFNECLQISGPLLDENQVRSILDEIKLVITACSSRMGERAERIEILDFDEELLIEENEKEKEIFDQVGAVLKTLVKAFDSSFLPFFDELSSYLMPMLGKDKTAQDDDVAEQCREAALRMAAQVDQEGQNQPPHTLSDEAYTMPTGENNDFDRLNFKDICIISSDDEDDYDLGEVACRRRVQSRELLGKWTGINENEGDWKVAWPPIMIIRNTRSEQDENGKWLGMGTEELLECHKSSGAVQARHAFGPEGHKGISVLIFDTSVEGYEKAQLLSKKYECQSIGRDNWNDKPSLFHPNGSRQLYGSLATEQDLEDFNQGLPEKWKLTFELASYEEKIMSQSEQWNKDIQQRKERELNDAREERYRSMKLGEKEMRG